MVSDLSADKSVGIVWFHAASLGEFEEARPVMEALKEKEPGTRILLTFFSPSGYEMKKDWKGADWVFCLPLDTPVNARRIVRAIRPKKAVFVNYEFWFNYLKQLHRIGCETCLMSFKAEKDSVYFKFYGFSYRYALRRLFKRISTKDSFTQEQLLRIGCKQVFCCGDTRLDRGFSLAATDWRDENIESWLQGSKAVIAGSTHNIEDRMLLEVLGRHPGIKFLIAPHNPGRTDIDAFAKACPFGALRYTETGGCIPAETQVMIIDTVGMLSRLYRYGFCAFIGGGFEGHPHSVVEAAVYGLPVAMGPKYRRNMHFCDMLAIQGATPVRNTEELSRWISAMQEPQRMETQQRILDYCRQSAGATERNMNALFI